MIVARMDESASMPGHGYAGARERTGCVSGAKCTGRAQKCILISKRLNQIQIRFDRQERHYLKEASIMRKSERIMRWISRGATAFQV